MQSVGFSSTYDDNSDADDEYERSAIGSPVHIPPEFESSPTESDPPTAQHTPTFPSADSVQLPPGIITQWTAEQCVDFFNALGMGDYSESMLEEGINGEALIATDLSDLKDLGVTSAGHRMTILKAVYDTKLKQGVRVEPGHYIPLSADVNAPNAAATRDDIARIVNALKLRDERIMAAEAELRHLREDLYRVSEENKRMREESLPLIRKFKDQSQPLPQPEDYAGDQSLPSPRPTLQDGRSSLLSRKISTKKLFTNSQPTIHEFGTDLDPSAAAIAASTVLSSSMSGSSLSPGGAQATSPTSPPYLSASGGIAPRPFGNTGNGSTRVPPDEQWPWPTTTSSVGDLRDTRTVSGTPLSARRPMTSASMMPPGSGLGDDTPGPVSAAISSEKPSETFKSFRVSMDDPCHKVLPAALKKYKIEDDWRQYSLYIVYGDQERCLGWDERPLILFKQLYREEKKPMFMLRKHAAPAEGFTTTAGMGHPMANNAGPPTGGLVPGSAGGKAGSMQFPGGVF